MSGKPCVLCLQSFQVVGIERQQVFRDEEAVVANENIIKEDMSRVDQLSSGLVRDAYLKHLGDLPSATREELLDADMKARRHVMESF